MMVKKYGWQNNRCRGRRERWLYTNTAILSHLFGDPAMDGYGELLDM